MVSRTFCVLSQGGRTWQPAIPGKGYSDEICCYRVSFRQAIEFSQAWPSCFVFLKKLSSLSWVKHWQNSDRIQKWHLMVKLCEGPRGQDGTWSWLSLLEVRYAIIQPLQPSNMDFFSYQLWRNSQNMTISQNALMLCYSMELLSGSVAWKNRENCVCGHESIHYTYLATSHFAVRLRCSS